MKGFISALALLCALVSAGPTRLQRRQSATSNDILNGNCQPVTFIFARGSTEGGNMGDVVGGPLCGMLKQATNGSVACQGVGGAYKATLGANFEANGTDTMSTQEAVNTFKMAMTKCPNAKIVAGGYSQGSAVISTAVQSLSSNEQGKINAVVFYGYTKNQQTMGMLPGYPGSQLKVFCRQDDGVCMGDLNVTPGHLAYGADGTVAQGMSFLIQTANIQQSGNSTSSNNRRVSSFAY